VIAPGLRLFAPVPENRALPSLLIVFAVIITSGPRPRLYRGYPEIKGFKRSE
jgi:hypothetical protein